MKTMQKILAVLLALVMVFAFVGCGGDDQAADDQIDDQATEEQAEEPTDESGDAEPQVSGDFPESVYVSLDGTPVRPGTKFGDVDGKIGTETADPVTNEPCDPAMEGPETEHYFDGYSVTVEQDDNVRIVAVDERMGSADAAFFCGNVRLGDSVDMVKEIMGEDWEIEEDESFLIYYFDSGNLMFYKDEEGNNPITGYVMSGY
ncbi:MAG: hypothetical protein J6Q41_06660 [Firmicutes bacterium]|nr:hypothetical protein [Bacillota bacterium]